MVFFRGALDGENEGKNIQTGNEIVNRAAKKNFAGLNSGISMFFNTWNIKPRLNQMQVKWPGK